MKDEFLKICEEGKLVGASYLVYNQGKIVENLQYGYSSIEDNRKMKDKTVIRIASISKVIVALCIMKLYEEGKISLDEDISTYLGFKVRNPKYPDVVINLKMVMTQTSSITDGQEKDVNSTIDTGYNLVNGTDKECAVRDLLDPEGKWFYKENYSNYRPGTHFEYSNFGCGILACIVEKITGKLFTEYVKEVVFKPLKLDASFIAEDIKSKDIATCYYVDDTSCTLAKDREGFIKGKYKVWPLGENFRGPAGGCFISTKDLMKIQITLLNGGSPILKKETVDRMMQMTWARKKDDTEAYTAKGLQLQITDYFDGRRLWGHFGCAYGVRSYFLFNTKEQFGMVFITNGGNLKDQDNGYGDVHEKLIRLALNKYWHPTMATTFKFNVNDDYGYVLDRKVELDFRNTRNGIFFSKLSLLDCLGLNVLEEYDYVNKEGKNLTLDEVLEHYKDKYHFDVQKNEDTYMISYKNM